MMARNNSYDPTEDSVSDLESQLESSLHPVRPNQEFVQRLRTQLVIPPDMELEIQPIGRNLLITLGIVMAVQMSILLAIQVIYGIIRGIRKILS